MKRFPCLFLLIFLFLFQCCAVYQKTPVSLEESVNKGRVMVFDADREYPVFENISLKDGLYYGLTKSKGEILLDPSLIEEVYLKNYKSSLHNKPVAKFISFTALAVVLIGAILILLYTGG